MKTLANDRENIYYPGPFYGAVLPWTWNDIGECYMNQKQSEMPFRTLANILLRL